MPGVNQKQFELLLRHANHQLALRAFLLANAPRLVCVTPMCRMASRVSTMSWVTVRFAFLAGALILSAEADDSYHVKADHPRLIIEDVSTMARRCAGPLAEDYRVVKERADAAVQRGDIEFISNPWSIPEDLMNCGLAYLVEGQLHHPNRQYADVIIKQWGDGSMISN